MRNLLLAVLLALFSHVALFFLDVGRAEQKSAHFPKPQPISLSLIHKYPPPKVAPPVRKKPDPPVPKPVMTQRPIEKKSIVSKSAIVAPSQEVMTIPEKIALLPESYSTELELDIENHVEDDPVSFRMEEGDVDPNSNDSEEIEYPIISTVRSIDAYIPENVIDETQASTPLPLQIAVPLQKKRPKYPRMARRRGYEGTVILKALIDKEGSVKELNILESSGHGMLDRAAEDSVRKWLFQPWMREDEPVEMWGKVIVRFKLR